MMMFNQNLNKPIKLNLCSNIASKSGLQKLGHRGTILTLAALMFVLILFSSTAYIATLKGDSPYVAAAYTVNETVSTESALRAAVNNAKGVASEYVIELASDVVLTGSTLSIPADANIVLISQGDTYRKLVGPLGIDTVTVESGADLVLDGIIITHNPGAAGRGVYVKSGAELTLKNGKISDNTATGNGGGVYNFGTFTMLDGVIANNTTTEFYAGGGVYNDGTFTMYYGVIANNTADYAGGVSNHHIFDMLDGVIANNTATLDGGGVTNHGTFTMLDGVIANNTAYRGGGVCNAGTFTMSDGKISANTARGSGGGVYNYGMFTLSGGEISNNTAERQYYADGGGVYNTATFTMSDGVIANNTAANDGGGVNNYGVFTMWGGVISDNTAGTFGGGVNNYYDCVFTMWGGVISDNTADWHGGGVLNYAAFTMLGGTISANTATLGEGGGVNNVGMFTMSGGMISDNTACSMGGGVYNRGTFTMEEGTILFNVAVYGGGVYNYVTFTMSDGMISDNTATRFGGGVCNSGVFTMFGGVISDNSAVNGGGVNVDTGSFELLAGTISGNTAGGNGGGVWVTDTTTNLNRLTVASGVVFSNNHASGAYNRNPTHNNDYNTYIGSDVTWSEPFIQGYNNYDISYVNGPQILYHISYNPNTATGSITSTVAIYNQDVTLKPNTFNNIGYTFVGWNTVADGTGEDYVDSQTFTYICTYDLELYAQWEPIEYTVIYQPGAYGIFEPISTTCIFGSSTPEAPQVTGQPGWKFIGWTPEPTLTVESDATYTAQWTKTVDTIFYTLNYNGNGYTSGTVPLGGSYPSGYQVLVTGQSSMVRAGYIFLGWAYTSDAKTPDFAAGSTSYLSLTGDVTLFAVWKTETSPPSLSCTITYLPGEYGTFKTATYVRSLGDLTPETPIVTGQVGWRFVGWSPEPTVTVLGDAVYVAQWEPVEFVVKFVDWNGAVLKTETVRYGTSAAPPANPTRNGYTFTGWNPNTLTNITSDLTITAEYTQNNNNNGNGNGNNNNNNGGSNNNNNNNGNSSGGSQAVPPASTPPPANSNNPPTTTTTTPPPPSNENKEETTQTWALVNLILSIAGLILAITIGICILLQQKKKQTKTQPNNNDNNNDYERETYKMQKGRQRNIWLAAASALGIAGIVVFLLTEDLTRTMTLVDNWTILNVLIFAAQLAATLTALTYICKHKKTNQHNNTTTNTE